MDIKELKKQNDEKIKEKIKLSKEKIKKLREMYVQAKKVDTLGKNKEIKFSESLSNIIEYVEDSLKTLDATLKQTDIKKSK